MKIYKKSIIYFPMLPLLIMSAMFMFGPVMRLVLQSFKDGASGFFTFSNWKTIFTEKIYLYATANSIKITLISTVAGLLISFLTAWSIREVSKKRANRYLSMINMLSNFAGLPLAYAFMTILGNAGFVTLIFKTFGVQLSKYFNLYGMQGLTLLAIYFQIPLGTLMLLPAFESVHKEWQESAALLKANELQFWLEVGIPVMLPSLFDTFALLFANALTAYASFVLLVVDNMPLLPIKVTYIFTGEVSGEKAIGAALGVWMMCLMIATIVICNILKKYFSKQLN